MARWVAIFEDNPGAGAIRARYRNDHFAYLAENADRITIAGGLRETPEAEIWTGGLWVFEVKTYEEAARLCEADPFFVHGLRRSYRILAWGKAPCYGDVTL